LLLLACGDEDNGNGTEPIDDVDDSPPGRVANLSVTGVTETNATLTWTAPGDDGMEGTAKEYDIRYALAVITDSTWDEALRARDEPSPCEAGTRESYVVTGLLPDTTYFFALKSADEVPNWSVISSIASVRTASMADMNGHWWHGYAPYPSGLGFNGEVSALTSYDGKLIAGGSFTEAGGVPASHIAYTNGGEWRAMGCGVSGGLGASVQALTVYDGELIAGGWFDEAGCAIAHNVAGWDGTSWRPLGTGMNGGVTALAVYDGDLIAGGWFSFAGGAPANLIARWDGSVWHPLGPGQRNPLRGPVSALLADGDNLYAGGAFTHSDTLPMERIARWDGSAWHEVGGGIGGIEAAAVNCLTLMEGDLIAAGSFSRAGAVHTRGIARWDGSSWSAIGGGFAGDTQPIVNAIAVVVGNRLAATGHFQRAGFATVSNIALWNGEKWRPLGSGLTGTDWPTGRAMMRYFSGLFIGGSFSLAGGKPSAFIALWDG
jgi:hypothetical protein